MTSVRKFVMQLAPHGVLLSGSRRQDHFVTKISFQCLGKPELFLSIYDPFEPETDLPTSGPLPDLWPPTDALREDWQRAWLREAVPFDTFRTAIRTIVRALAPDRRQVTPQVTPQATPRTPLPTRHFEVLSPYQQVLADKGHCMADDDGYCCWEGCPQIRDNEPTRTGRHCPRDIATRARLDPDNEGRAGNG